MHDPDRHGTRQRILDAAGRVFAREGFRAATVRSISNEAGTNVALLHYYFKDKAGLYQAVLEELFERGFIDFPADQGLMPGADAADRLRAFIRAFIFRLLSGRGWGGYAGKARLLVKELADPSPFMARMVERFARPHKELLASIVAELLGDAARPDLVALCALSVIGQCLHYAYNRPVIAMLGIAPEEDDAGLENLARHVAEFSLGGVARIRAAAAGDES